MSDEEDYMSDAFLQNLPETRPGLVPKHVAKVHEKQKKEKVANEKNKQKPKAVLEKEHRETGLGVALSSDNKGFSMLQKMGYKPGMAIGKSGVGRTEPVPVELKLGRGGLGKDADTKRKKEQRTQMIRNMSVKRQKMEVEHKQNFMQRMNDKVNRIQIEKDLYKSQKVCEHLDSQLGVTEPHELFFWPESMLPGSNEDDDDDGEPLDRLEQGYSDCIQDEAEGQEGEESEEETTEDTPPVAYTTEDKLDVITLYLRTKHKYCIWCGIKYEDKDDLMRNCPGNSAELHDD